jgi:hypothetical protein
MSYAFDRFRLDRQIARGAVVGCITRKASL